ncbi:hypothetical protein SAMN05444920_102516 [Nonomuraea solani]|uniref:Uncharacterized protein n=1 Tax=Nonomuraea solani TaxID=1144553 RepID=A0A1H5Z2N9_9ACTN|nr:DUF5708 family protein [Nonomuraea solani]SEG30522.1 hypothetical protein SAMN05444920_102516 [Nonomuraea solani]
MASARKTLLTGLATFVAGAALWLFGGDIEIVVITPTKLGVVLMVIGGLEALYGLYKVTTRADR